MGTAFVGQFGRKRRLRFYESGLDELADLVVS